MAGKALSGVALGMDESHLIEDEDTTGALPLLVAGLLLLVAIGGAIDLVLDRPSRWLSAHVAFEVAMMVVSLSFAIWLYRGWRQATQSLRAVRRSFAARQATLQAGRDQWRENAQSALAGLTGSETAAALLPCPWTYHEIGQRLAPVTHPLYAEWAAFYIGGGLAESVRAWTELVEHTAATAGACAEHLDAGSACPSLCPGLSIPIKDTLLSPVIAFDTEDEVIEAANDTPYGLAAYVWTRDLSRAVRVSEQLDYGIIGVNDPVPSTAQAPFGGVKQSGFGREGGHWGLDEYLYVKFTSIGVQRA